MTTSSNRGRRELDLVLENETGHLVGHALGWLDASCHSVLIEPVGVTPAYSGRGLGRAICRELLRAAAGRGAMIALVYPRGDRGYPVPRRLYEGLGMREVGREATYAWYR